MVLETLADKVDQLIVGGGIANTFLAAAGKPVGKSLYEPDLVAAAQALMVKVNIPLPTDVVVGKEFSETAEARTISVDDVADDDMIFDIGPGIGTQSVGHYCVHGHHYLEWSCGCL
jgi:phosphoglycerate kinase